MLKITVVRLEKISDPDKCMVFEQGMRRGVSYINKRYREASKHDNDLLLYPCLTLVCISSVCVNYYRFLHFHSSLLIFC